MQWQFEQLSDLRHPTGVMSWPDQLMVEGDHEAHVWRVHVLEDAHPVDMTGYQVMAYFDRIDGMTVPVPGTVDGNLVSVTLPQSVYAAPGGLLGAMRASRNGQTVTLAAGRWTVRRGPGDVYVDPGHVIPSLEELLAKIGEMEAATASAQAAASAAYTAAETSSPPVVLSGEGKAVTLDGAAEGRRLVGLRVFGASVQAAAPAPDAPADVSSVTEPVVTLTGTDGAVQTLTVAGVTLRGVKVTGSADYTDADGANWIADEVDFGRGVLVKRIGVRVFDGTESWTAYGVTTGTYRAWQGSYSKLTERVDRGAVMTHYPVLANYADLYYGRVVGAYAGGAGMDMGRIILCGDYATADALKAYLAAQHAAGTPLTVYYVLKEPVETALTDEQLAGFAALRVGADMSVASGTWVRAEYVGDTKGYIDRAAAHVPEADHAADADTVRGVDVVSRVDAADADIASLKEDAAAIQDNASNALVRTASGHHVLIEDVSPITHNLRVQVSSETVDDLTGIRLIRCGKNLCSDLVKGVGLNTANGAELVKDTAATSGYIPISFADDAVFVISGLPGTLYNVVAAYNADKVFVGRTSAGVNVKRVMDASSYTSGTPQGTGEIAYLRVTCYQNLDGQTIDDVDGAEIQLELGTEPTAYEPYVEPTEHTPGADGAVEGVRSVYPSTTLFTMTAGVSIVCGYNRDINKGYADAVKDVRIDGVSVVAEGVANISKYDIVKDGMCDGKGAAWTSDEQAAARARMGIPGDYELIASVELTEDMADAIVITEDLNAENFSLKSCIVRAKTPIVEENANMWFSAMPEISTGYTNAIRFSASVITTIENITTVQFNKNGVAFPILVSNKQLLYPILQPDYETVYTVKKLLFSAAGGKKLPAGVKIYVYGVRE